MKNLTECPNCCSDLEGVECWSCGGEGGRGWDDLQFEDPLWYSPGDFIKCNECYGTGYHYKCFNCGNVYDIKELNKQSKNQQL